MRYSWFSGSWAIGALVCLTAVALCGESGVRLRAADPAVAAPDEREVSAEKAAASEISADEAPKYETLHITGRVVWLADALRRLYGIETDPDVAQAQVALETPEGRLYSIAKDARGRAFSLDERIRDIDVELIVRHYRNAPVVQMVKMYTLKDTGKYEFDYWCDICAIPMYELKPCECCQGDIRIRERRVADAPSDGGR